MNNLSHSSYIKPLKFRYDINFLRAISVIAVIIYHFNKTYLKGGWLGVDLFFFISGYLIFNKLYLGIHHDRSFLRVFYKKRFLRLTPALLFMTILSSLINYFVLTPYELLLHLKSAFYSNIYLSNFFYSNLDFYNSPSNKYLTLLHTWSLGIEEQFYIIIPLLIYPFIKNFQTLKKFLVLASLISLFINIFFNSNYIFYSTIFRIWEFLAGSIFLIFEKYLKKIIKIKTTYLGLFIIGLSFYFFNDEYILSIVPKVVLIFGVILFLKDENINNFFVNSKSMQFTGKISYSLYLYHQPILALYFIQNDKVQTLSIIEKITFFSSLLIISYLSWKFIELGFNNLTIFKYILLLYFLIIIAFGLIIFDIPDNFYTLNIPNRLFLLKVKEDAIVEKDGKSCNNRTVEETCIFYSSNAAENIYILSDSSLRTLTTSILNNKNFEGYNIIHFTGNDCIFIFGQHPSKNSCPNKNVESKNQFGFSISNSTIIYGARFPRYFTGKGFNNGYVEELNDISVIPNLKQEIQNTLDILEKNNNKIILIYPIPEQGWNVPELFFYKKLDPFSTVSYPSNIWYDRQKESVEFLDSLNLKNVVRIYPTEIFCDSFIKNECIGAINGNIYYADDDHLNLIGSDLLTELISNNLFNK